MSDKGIRPIVSEYHILWEALKNYEEKLAKMSAMTTDEDQELKYDEKLQDIEGILNSLKISAKNGLELKKKLKADLNSPKLTISKTCRGYDQYLSKSVQNLELKVE